MTGTDQHFAAPSRASWVGALVVVAGWVSACGGIASTPPPHTATTSSVAASATAPEPESSPSEPTVADEITAERMRQGFRECYQIGLWNNPHQSGSVRLVVKLDPRGRPAAVTPVGGTGLDRMVVACLVRIARRASFAATDGDGSIVLPLTFRSDRARETSARPTASSSTTRH